MSRADLQKKKNDNSSIASLIRLKYPEDVNTLEWKKEEFDYSSDLKMQMPSNFQELLTGNLEIYVQFAVQCIHGIST